MRFIIVLATAVCLVSCSSKTTTPSNQPPGAGSIVAKPSASGLLTATTFTFTPSGFTDPESDTLTFTWDFGDGSAAGSGASVQHAYASASTFVVKVSVSDGHNTPVTAQLNVTTRTLTGTWQGSLTCVAGGCVASPRTITLNLTQTGSTVTGTCNDSHVGVTFAAITVQTFAIDPATGKFTFTGGCGSGNVLFGSSYDPGADQFAVANWDSPALGGPLTRH